MDVAKPVCDAGGTPLYGTQYLATGEFHYVAHIGNTEGHNSVPPLYGTQWLIAGGLPWSWLMCIFILADFSTYTLHTQPWG